MLQEHNKCFLPDQSNNRNDLGIEIFPDKDEVKITLKENKTWIKIQDLYALVFVLVDAEKKEEMMPMKQTTIKKYIRQHRVRLKNDLKRGQEMVVNCVIDVPETVEYHIKGLMKKSPILTA